jgi:hypothetical protein
MRIVIAVTSLMLASCVSVGTNYDPTVAEQLSLGTSRAQVIALLGQPNSRTIGADGTEFLMWLHSRGTGWGTAKARSVTMQFDQQGRYIKLVNSTQTRIN